VGLFSVNRVKRADQAVREYVMTSHVEFQSRRGRFLAWLDRRVPIQAFLD
jgi:hypothetical protein